MDGSNGWDEVEKAQKLIEMATKLAYLTLLLQIVDVNNLLELNAEFLSHLDNVNNFAIIEGKIKKCEMLLRPKISWQMVTKNLSEVISNNDLEGFLKSDPTDSSNEYINNYKGIPFKVIKDNFDVTNFVHENKQISDLPLHGYVLNSIGYTAETNILFNACYFINKSRLYIKRYTKLIEGKIIANISENERILHNELYQQINFSSIQAFLNIITFIECFTNSVANNHLLSINLNKDIVDYMSDKDKISTQEKLLTYPMLINNQSLNDAKHYYSSNKHLLANNSFNNPYNQNMQSFMKFREHRDSYIHHSPNQFVEKPKVSIILNPTDWYNLAERTFTTCTSMAKQFWFECYHKEGPHYLFDLDENELAKAGHNLLIQEIHILGDLLNNGYFS